MLKPDRHEIHQRSYRDNRHHLFWHHHSRLCLTYTTKPFSLLILLQADSINYELYSWKTITYRSSLLIRQLTLFNSRPEKFEGRWCQSKTYKRQTGSFLLLGRKTNKKMVCFAKKISTLFIIIFSLIHSRASSQQYRLIAFGGYSIGETFTGSLPEDKLKSSAHYGGILEFRINHRYSLELLYQRQNTSVDLDGKPLYQNLRLVGTWPAG